MRNYIPLCLMTSFALGFVGTAAASPLAVFGVWNEFTFRNVSEFARGCFDFDPDLRALVCEPPGSASFLLHEPPWEFTAPIPVILSVTDGFISGDAFDVFDFGTLIGSTPLVPPGSFCGNSEDFCLANPGISHAQFGLPAGPHQIEIKPIATVGLFAGAFMRVDVPEPTCFWLFATGAFGVWAFRLRLLAPGRR